MNRGIIRRIEVLEEKAPKDTGRWHTIMVASDEEEERETAALKASRKWTEGDNLFVIRLVAGEFPEGRDELDNVDPPSMLAAFGQGDGP
jgi:hypothetical protein